MGEGGWKGLGKDEIRWCGYFEAERLAALNTTASTSGGVTWVSSNGLLQSDSSNFYWDNTNNRLGIGTNSPRNFSSGLEVGGTGAAVLPTTGTFQQLEVTGGDGSTQRLSLGVITNSSLGTPGTGIIQALTDGSAFRPLLLNPRDGDVAIGSSTTGGRLKVSDAGDTEIRIDSEGGSNNDSILSFYENNVSRGSIYWDGNANDFVWTSSTGDISLIPNGNVGVGLITPLSAFHVSGGASFQGNISSYPAAGNVNAVDDLDIDFPSVTSNNATIRIFRNTNNSATNSFQIYKADATSTIQHLFHSNGNSYVQLNTGNFGIGTNLPAKTLHVSGAICTSGANAQYFVGASGGITALITPVDLTTKSLLFSGGLLVGYG